MLFSNSLILALGVVTGIITARVLGPSDRGTLAALFLWPQIFAALGLFSLNESMLVQKRIVASSDFRVDGVLRASVLMAAATVGVGLAATHAVLPSEPPVGKLAACFLAIYVPCNFVTLVLLSEEQRRGNYRVFNRLRVAGPAIYLGGIAILAGLGAISLVSTAVVSLAANIVVAGLLIRRHFHSFFQRVEMRDVLDWLRLSAPVHMTGVLALASSQVDRVAVAAFFSPRDIGLYTAAVTVAGSLLGAIGATAQSYLIPEASRPLSLPLRRQLIVRALGILWIALTGTAIGLGALCPVAVPSLFGEEYRPSVTASVLTVTAYAPYAARQVAVRVLRVCGHNQPGYISEAISIVLFIAGLASFRAQYGLLAVCFSAIAANVFALGYCALELQRKLAIAPEEWLLPNPAKLWDARPRNARMAA